MSASIHACTRSMPSCYGGGSNGSFALGRAVSCLSSLYETAVCGAQFWAASYLSLVLFVTFHTALCYRLLLLASSGRCRSFIGVDWAPLVLSSLHETAVYDAMLANIVCVISLYYYLQKITGFWDFISRIPYRGFFPGSHWGSPCPDLLTDRLCLWQLAYSAASDPQLGVGRTLADAPLQEVNLRLGPLHLHPETPPKIDPSNDSSVLRW